MRRLLPTTAALLLVLTCAQDGHADLYTFDSTVPAAGGCPQPNHFNLALSSPMNRRWSTSLPSLLQPTVLTAASAGTPAQLTEIEQAIFASFGAWSGVSGVIFNAAENPGLVAPLARVATANSCSNDAENNVDGLNTICFNQSSSGFTTGVLAFTRTITADAPGITIGATGPSLFAGQILDSDTLFRNDGQATYATPAALSTPQGQGAYDLESLLTHELGHWLGLDHSAVIRAIMFPFAPPPGQFIGARPTAEIPDGMLADDDRTGARFLYPDPNDSVDVGSIRGRILPANSFTLATFPSPSPGSSVTGIVGVHVVAVDASTGAVIAGALGGWSCSASSPPTQFDGSFDLERLPVNRSYNLYAEPLVGLALPSNFSFALASQCSASFAPTCVTPAVNTNFNIRIYSGSP
ncbi:MAG TPA: matrixin family metalloprotease [Candidatus Acidoferrales bacterium]